MKHPVDEYEDARRTAESLDREHSDAKLRGYYEGGTGGSVTGLIKGIAKLLILLLVLGVVAVAALVATGNEEVLQNILG